MQSYMGVNEGNDGIIGKLLYYSTANILIPKDKFIELGNAFNLPKVKPANLRQAHTVTLQRRLRAA